MCTKLVVFTHIIVVLIHLLVVLIHLLVVLIHLVFIKDKNMVRLCDLKQRAHKKGLLFDLTDEWLCSKLKQGTCEATGIEFEQSFSSPYYSVIDRIDTTSGYTQGNCQVVCWIFNNAKADNPVEVFELWAKALCYKVLPQYEVLTNYEEEKKSTVKPRRVLHPRPTDLNELKLYTAAKMKQRNEKLRQSDPKKYKLDRLFYYSKVRAKEKKMEHSLTYEWLQQQTQNNICSATGIKFDYDTTKIRNPFGPSINRIDTTKGFTPENCRLVIWAFNAGLGCYSEQDLYTVCKAYLEFNNIK